MAPLLVSTLVGHVLFGFMLLAFFYGIIVMNGMLALFSLLVGKDESKEYGLETLRQVVTQS